MTTRVQKMHIGGFIGTFTFYFPNKPTLRNQGIRTYVFMNYSAQSPGTSIRDKIPVTTLYKILLVQNFVLNPKNVLKKICIKILAEDMSFFS